MTAEADWRSGALPPDWSDWGLDDASLDWQDGALCAQVGGEWWFPDQGESSWAAKKVCARCPVRAECLAYALANTVTSGVWGGLGESERRAILTAERGRTPCALPGCDRPRGLTGHGHRRKYCSDEHMFEVRDSHVAAVVYLAQRDGAA